MIRLFEFRDLDKIMEIWLQGNLEAHAFVNPEYWKKNFNSVRSVLPNAEVYVYEADGEVLGFIGIDAEYIAGIFVAAGYKGQGIGRQLIEAVKKKNRLSLHVYEKNNGAINFYLRQGFTIRERMIEKETGEKECLMVCDSESRENRTEKDAVGCFSDIRQQNSRQNRQMPEKSIRV